MKKILLTGGSGFIGRNIIESFLNQKYKVFAPTHKEFDLIDSDSVKSYLSNQSFDILVHSAVKPGHRNAKDHVNLFYSNCRQFFNLVKFEDRFEKVIILGSGAIYDMSHALIKVKEEYFGAHIPEDEHGFTKYVCETYINNSENIVDLRVFSIFGKYEDYAIRFISNAICKAIFDLPITIKQNRKFDFIYIDDFINVLDFIIENKLQFKSYNVTPDNSIELLKLAKIVLKISNKDLPVKIAQPGMGLEYSGDNSRIKNEYKNYKTMDIFKSVELLYKWYFDNRALINKNLLLFDK